MNFIKTWNYTSETKRHDLVGKWNTLFVSFVVLLDNKAIDLWTWVHYVGWLIESSLSFIYRQKCHQYMVPGLVRSQKDSFHVRLKQRSTLVRAPWHQICDFFFSNQHLSVATFSARTSINHSTKLSAFHSSHSLRGANYMECISSKYVAFGEN